MTVSTVFHNDFKYSPINRYELEVSFKIDLISDFDVIRANLIQI